MVLEIRNLKWHFLWVYKQRAIPLGQLHISPRVVWYRSAIVDAVIDQFLRGDVAGGKRVYENEFDDVKTDAGKREVPFDKHGIILAAIRRMWASNKKFRKPDDLVFANKVGRPLDRHNLLNRHLKPIAERLGLPTTVDFRSFRTMHASLMRRFGARLDVARDNMGHAGGTGSITLDVYFEDVVERACRGCNSSRRSRICRTG